jgi:ssDNA-binding Zn-finger/Zn-ribbon topoisomerase 1
MKTFIINLAGVLTALTLTTTAALAADTAKGGGKRLTELSSLAQVVAVQKGDVVVTSCPKCRTVVQNRVKATAKGGGSAVERVATHGCPGCGAKIETTGHGKAKTDKVTHVCSHCGSNEAFCSVLKAKDDDTK